MLAMIRQRIAAIAATTVAVAAIGGIGIAYAASSVNVPSSGGQLTGTVDICVNTANEGQQYVELNHPAPGNCAAGYLQYQANQPDADSPTTGPPVVNVNSESFVGTVNSTTGQTTVVIPPGSHIVGTPTAIDLDASAAHPVTVTVTSVDNATSLVKVAYSVALAAADTIQITYDYQL